MFASTVTEVELWGAVPVRTHARALCEMCRLVCEYEEFERKINWSEFFLAWTLPYDRMLSALRGRARSRTRQERSGAAHTRSHMRSNR